MNMSYLILCSNIKTDAYYVFAALSLIDVRMIKASFFGFVDDPDDWNVFVVATRSVDL